MHLGAQLLELLLVGDAEMLLLVDDDQAEILELDGLAEKRMRADDDIDLALGEALLGFRQFRGADQPRGLRDVDRIVAHPLAKGLEVLAREQGGRHDDGDLLAVHGGNEGGAQRHFGLAETDIAADQAIHRAAGGKVLQHGGDGGLLVVGLVVGKAGGEFVVEAWFDGEKRRLAQLPLGRDLDELARDLADAILHARLARLPGGGAEAVELDAGFLRAVARQKLDILDRQEQLVAARIVDFEAVVRRAGGLDGAQADEAADAVIDMHDDVAGGEARDLGDEILRALRGAARANEALAENVLLGDQRDIGGDETGIEAEHGERDLRARQPLRLRPRRDTGEIEQAVLGEHMLHALARTAAPHGDDDALAGRLQGLDVGLHRVEDVGVGFAPLRREIVAGVGADIDGVGALLGRRERRKPRQRRTLEPGAPFVLGEIKPVRRQRLIGRAAARLIHHVLAGLVIVGDLREPLMGGFFGERLDGERRAFQIIEQRLHLLVEERQPMLDAARAAALADGFVERVVRRGGAEGGDIAGAEQADGVAGELKLRHRHEIERAQLGRGALGFRIEGADRFQRVAEKVEPDGLGHAGRKQIDDAAADGVFAGFAHGRGADEAVELEPFGDPRHGDDVAGRGRERLTRQDFARRHALEHGVDGGEQDRRALAALDAREPRQRGHALRHHAGMRRHAVVRQAIPGREFEHLDVGREEGERARQRRHARAVAADHRETDRGRGRAGGHRAGEIGEHEPFGAVGDAGKMQRPPGRKPLRRRPGRISHVGGHLFVPGGDVIAAAVEGNQCREHRGVIRRRRALGAGDPGVEVGIGRFDQPLEIVEACGVELVDMGIGEAADDEIHLAHAAPPGPEQKLAPPLVQPFARSLGHRANPGSLWAFGGAKAPTRPNAKSPDAAGRGVI